MVVAAAKAGPVRRVAVAGAADAEVLTAVCDARQAGIADAVLVGDAAKIRAIAAQHAYDLAGMEVCDVPDNVQAARMAVQLVRDGRAHMLMKGLISTADALRAVLDKEHGLRTGRVLSHIAILEVPAYHKFLFLTDGGQNITPDVRQKAEILANAVEVANVLGVSLPKVAPICAVEVVNPKMQATLDAAELAAMASRGEIANCIVSGPIALDGAISAAAAAHKGIKSEVAGDVDILLMPDIEAGNILYKALVYLAGAKVAGIIAGAAAPIVLTSRADSPEAKLFSIACASVVAGGKRNGAVRSAMH